MKQFCKLLIATLAILCLSFNANAFQSPTLPYDLILLGLDSDVNTSGEDQIILLTTRDITDGYRFGITNSLADNSIWITKHSSVEYVNIKYIGGDPILQGSALKLLIKNNGVEIEIDDKSVTDQFEFDLSPTYAGDFITSSIFYFSVYSGIMTKSVSKANLLGTTLDVLAYGITETETRDIVLDGSVKDKEILLPSSSGTVATIIDRDNCNLCEILLLMLFSENWLNLPNTYGFDLDGISFDIKDCIELDCPGDLIIDALDCNTLYVSNMPCDSITFYQWSKVVSGQLQPIISGDSAPIPNLVLQATGLYQLHIICADGCTEISNRYYADCFEDDCDFNISIEEENCIVSITLTGCPNPSFQWYVQTEIDNYMIAESNSSSITAEENGLYYAIITGCPDCAEAVSPSIDVNCGENCLCDIDFYIQDCLLYFDTTGCENYNGYLEYSSDTSDVWIYLGAQNSPYDPSEYGNGSYQLILSSNECSDTLAQLYVNCISPCDEAIVFPSFDESCNLIFNWEACFNPSFTIQYAADCTNYTNGGADLISSVILPDGSGSAEYLPLSQQGCYQLLLDCNEECLTYSKKIELVDCCTSTLSIDTSNCVISVSNIPCSGNFTYSLLANGEIIETGVNSTNFTLAIDQNATYQILIECDGCSYYSNVISADCGTEECQVDPLLEIDECTLTAMVENCNNSQIQWQEYVNSIWVDISGETGTAFDILIDGTFRYVLTGCGCIEEPLYSVEYTSNCFTDCNCNINLWIDSTTCTINSIDSGCDLILSIEWYYEESPNTWTPLPQFSGYNSISPNLNGNYKKVIVTKDCGKEEAEINVTCLDECTDLNLELNPVGCTITVAWEGCFELNNWEWTFTSSTGNPSDCGTSGTPQPAQYEIISQTGSNISGLGSMEIKPSIDGCYTFTIDCNEDCDETVSTEFQVCCSEDAEIVLDDTPDQLCDYCFFNESTDELIDIYVLIDGVEVALSIYEDYFDFPYCDETGPFQSCDPNLPTFVDLINDINSWFAAYGYKGEAFIGNGVGVCKGIYTPFWIQQSNIVFETSYLFEDLTGYQIHPFLEDNCNEDTGSEPQLKVINTCLPAEFLWSTGETTQSIKYEQGQSYSVTITCQDGCSIVLSYDGSASSMVSNENDRTAIQWKDKVSDSTLIFDSRYEFKAFPVPTRESFIIQYFSKNKGKAHLMIYTGSGKMVKKIDVFSHIGLNTKSIDASFLQDGIYFAQLVNNDVSYGFQKIVIIK